MTAEEAVRQAEAEGLMLLKADNNTTGYKGVYWNNTWDNTKPYQAQVRGGGKKVYLGNFVMAEEAALRVLQVERRPAQRELYQYLRDRTTLNCSDVPNVTPARIVRA